MPRIRGIRKMAARRRSSQDDVAELLKTLLITQLALAAVPGPSIRAVVGCDMNRVTAVLKHLKSVRKIRPKQSAS